MFGVYFNAEQWKIHQRPVFGNHYFSLQWKVFLRSLTNYSNLIYFKNKWHFSSFPEILSLLTPFCDHIVLRIYRYAIYKIYYLVFRYISRGAVCFYVFMIGSSHRKEYAFGNTRTVTLNVTQNLSRAVLHQPKNTCCEEHWLFSLI